MSWRLAALAGIVLAGCGGNSGSGIDASGGNVDARFPSNCTMELPGNPQCSNCKDDDGDGHIDGFDVQCTG
ncbi:MAG: hypothetical protein H0T46_15120, partial [Deltaproteobacteria bacterium]|nr:hypothetical protein [Deltaproteobacteria bacterium]